ncbi:hypothetical protein XaC1_495 [Xanthomonas phage XaC1]|nr:hypothetical protein XaC1_495 [Xanthomonas phage XaC1]
MSSLAIVGIVITVIAVLVILYYAIKKHYHYYTTYYRERSGIIDSELRSVGVRLHSDYHNGLKFVITGTVPVNCSKETKTFSAYFAGRILYRMQKDYYMAVLKPYFEEELIRFNKEQIKNSYKIHKG